MRRSKHAKAAFMKHVLRKARVQGVYVTPSGLSMLCCSCYDNISHNYTVRLKIKDTRSRSPFGGTFTLFINRNEMMNNKDVLYRLDDVSDDMFEQIFNIIYQYAQDGYDVSLDGMQIAKAGCEDAFLVECDLFIENEEKESEKT